MRKLVKDQLTNQWILIGEDLPLKEEAKGAGCPFCPGNEWQTTKEILRFPSDEKQPWQIRVFPNINPVVRIEGDLNRRPAGIYDVMDGIGAHEIIVETPRHNATLGSLSVEELTNVIKVYQQRISDLKKDDRFRYILIFKNHGYEVGAQITHPHSQLIATPFVPRRVEEELRSCKYWYQLKERCLLCDISVQEIADGSRIVAENKYFISFCPAASRFPYETWLMPKKSYHSSKFETLSTDTNGNDMVSHLASILKETLSRLEKVVNAYTVQWHTSPNELSADWKPDQWKTLAEDYHWHIEILPRPAQITNFERGAGIFVNPVEPEQAARTLREIKY